MQAIFAKKILLSEKTLGLGVIMVLHISFVMFVVAKLSCQTLIVLKNRLA